MHGLLQQITNQKLQYFPRGLRGKKTVQIKVVSCFVQEIKNMLSNSTSAILLAQAQISTLELMLSAKAPANQIIYRDFQKRGFEYILNPHTEELHDIRTDKFLGSHNLRREANLSDFIGLVNLGSTAIHNCQNGTEIPIRDLESRQLLGFYTLNKCDFCFPNQRRSRGDRLYS